jgi:hypothetical protein
VGLDAPPTIGGRVSTGGSASTGGNVSTGGIRGVGGCCTAFAAACTYGTYVGLNVYACPQGATCHEETQYCGACTVPGLCADYSGDAAAGGNVSTGGGSSTGGTTSVSVDAGSGCTGNFEILQSTKSLCVANMATIAAPNGYPNYGIDVTEVTKGQYDLWLGTNPALPVSTDATARTRHLQLAHWRTA